jgi:hypothetical protein
MRTVLILILLGAVVSCSSDRPTAGASGGLTVHVGVFGGPMRPDGQMAASNTPQQDARITVTDNRGHTWTARTNRSGIASFTVPAGRYFVHAPCGPVAPKGYPVRAGHTARVNLRCDVP